MHLVFLQLSFCWIEIEEKGLNFMLDILGSHNFTTRGDIIVMLRVNWWILGVLVARIKHCDG